MGRRNREATVTPAPGRGASGSYEGRVQVAHPRPSIADRLVRASAGNTVGKTAVIFGAGSGIGVAAAPGLAALDYRLALLVRTASNLASLGAELKVAGATAKRFVADGEGGASIGTVRPDIRASAGSDPNFRRRYTGMIVVKVAMSTDMILITGARSTLEHPLVSGKPAPAGGTTLELDQEWCGREDSNFHVLSDTTTSTLRVYQFRHDRTCHNRRGTGGR